MGGGDLVIVSLSHLQCQGPQSGDCAEMPTCTVLLAVAGCRTLLSAPSCTTHGRTDCILPMVIQVRSVRNTGDFSSSRSIEMYFF